MVGLQLVSDGGWLLRHLSFPFLPLFQPAARHPGNWKPIIPFGIGEGKQARGDPHLQSGQIRLS